MEPFTRIQDVSAQFLGACLVLAGKFHETYGSNTVVFRPCVLSPKLFCAVLDIAMSSWRARMEAQGLNLHDGIKALLALRFADDLLVFATSRGDTIRLLEELVTSLGQVGLKLNTSKTKILTTQAQPGRFYESWSSLCFTKYWRRSWANN